MADAIAVGAFNACADKYTTTPSAREDAGIVALRAAMGQFGIPDDVAARGAASAAQRGQVSNTLGCTSEVLAQVGHAGGAVLGIANLSYAKTVRDVFNAQKLFEQLR